MISPILLKELVAYDPKNEARVLLVRDSVVSQFEASTRRIWKLVATPVEVIKLDRLGVKLPTVFLTKYPLGGTVLVKELVDDVWTALDPELYSLDAIGGILVNETEQSDGSVATQWPSQIQVSADTAGYADDAAPANAIEAIAIEIRHRLSRFGEDKIHVLSESLAQAGTVQFTEATFHPMFSKAIRAYRRSAKNF